MFESGNASSIPLSPPYELVVSGRFENGATHEALTLPEPIYSKYLLGVRLVNLEMLSNQEERRVSRILLRTKVHSACWWWTSWCLLAVKYTKEWRDKVSQLISDLLVCCLRCWSLFSTQSSFQVSALFHLNVVGFRNKTHFQLSPLSVLSVNFPKALVTLQVQGMPLY